MARMTRALSPGVMAKKASAFECHLELELKAIGESGHWKIDDEPICESWHDSSWMLRKGLVVIEELDIDPQVHGWAQGWHIAPVSDIGFPMLTLAELG